MQRDRLSGIANRPDYEDQPPRMLQASHILAMTFKSKKSSIGLWQELLRSIDALERHVFTALDLAGGHQYVCKYARP